MLFHISKPKNLNIYISLQKSQLSHISNTPYIFTFPNYFQGKPVVDLYKVKPEQVKIEPPI